MEYTILDASNDFASLSNKIGRSKEELCNKHNLNFYGNDFRIITLDSIQQILLSLTAYIRGFMECQRIVNNGDQFLKVLKLGLSQEQIENGGIIYKFPIESLVTMIHFQIDAYFGQLCELTNNPQTGFHNRMEKIFESINDEDNMQNDLQCLAFVRNSFHSSGVHSKYYKRGKEPEPEKGTIDKIFEYNNCQIEFKHGERIFYNRKTAYLLIESSVSILQKVINYHSI